MKSISAGELEQLLRRKSRSSFISLTAVTDPDMRRRHNPFCTQDGRKWISHVRKVSILGGALINVSFTNMVDKRRLQEHIDTVGSRPPEKMPQQQRAWGKNLDDCPLVHHIVDGESRLYLHVVVRHRTDHFFDSRTGERFAGERLATLNEWLNERDSGYGNQKLRSPVIVKDFTLTNVAELTADKHRYTIAPAARELQTYLPVKTKPAASLTQPRRTRSSQRRQPAKGAS